MLREDVQHVQVLRPFLIDDRSRHSDPDQLTFDLGDSYSVFGPSWIGQSGHPKALSTGQ